MPCNGRQAAATQPRGPSGFVARRSLFKVSESIYMEAARLLDKRKATKDDVRRLSSKNGVAVTPQEAG